MTARPLALLASTLLLAGCGADPVSDEDLAGPTDGGAAGDLMPFPACQGPIPRGEPFAAGPYGKTPFTRADDLTLPTVDGDFSLQETWTGCDSYVFLLYSKASIYTGQLWKSTVENLFNISPGNVHYVFLSYARDPATAKAEVSEMKTRFDKALAVRSPQEQATWKGRFHYVTTGALDLGNWLSSMLQAQQVPAFTIDRFQRLREAGLLRAVQPNAKADIDFLTYEARHYNFEWTREQRLAKQGAMVIPVIVAQTAGEAFGEVDLPDAATMATFDSLEVDLRAACDGHLDSKCAEWDYLAGLFLCDKVDPKKCEIELARFITTYHREGRWVSDISPLLALLSDGGHRRFRYKAGNTYTLDLSLRLFNQKKGGHPYQATFLYGGGGFGKDYNDKYKPLNILIPADVTRVQIAATITGHGFGVEKANCAEFCNHEHHFTVNGAEFVKDHEEAGTGGGCIEQIEQGTVPNQFGTWPLGRGGWCPGKDAPPWVVDVTSKVKLGAMNTITYKATVDGVPYVPVPSGGGNGGFGARIDMTSYLVFWK
ncbi:MAG: hypothetical protein EXR72_23135 [Myxococcales bacterium]|nr:hypothetical protein [Myxococcales bacterium]